MAEIKLPQEAFCYIYYFFAAVRFCCMIRLEPLRICN